MKVLMYGWEFPPEISGGLGVACFGIVKSLIKKIEKLNLVLPVNVSNILGDNLAIVNCGQRQHTFTAEEIENLSREINIHAIKTLIHPYISSQEYQDILFKENSSVCHTKQCVLNTEPLTGKYGKNLFSEVIRYSFLAGDVAKNTDFDIIHAHDWLTGLAALEAKKLTGKPVVFQVHALEYDRSEHDHLNEEVYKIERHVMKKADAIIAVSSYTKNLIVKYYGIEESKVTVIYNGIEIDKNIKHEKKPILKPNKKVVLFLGRVTHQKGPWHFIEVAKKVIEKDKNIHFIMAGSGNLLYEMIEKVAQMGIGANVHFTGFLSRKYVDAIFNSADVYVMPSVSEPFGLSALEALSYNLPIIISKQSGVAEVLPHALKADFWDIENMADKILTLASSPVLQQEIVHESQKNIEALTWDAATDKMISLYNKVINEKRHG